MTHAVVRRVKYIVAEHFTCMTGIKGYVASSLYLTLSPDGELLIRAGWMYDGPSGPTLDTPSFMTASLVHDALYSLMRAGLVHTRCRRQADELMYNTCLEHGMWKLRAWWCLRAVRRFGAKSAHA